MLKMVDGTGIIGVDMICPLGVSTPQPPNYDRVELEGAGMLVLPNSLDAPLERLELGGKTGQVQTTGKNLANPSEFVVGTLAGDTGNIINLKQYIATGYIPVIPGKRYSTSCGNKFSAHTITAYDKEKTKINSPINMSSEMPEGAAYIRQAYKKIDMTNVTESDMEELKKVCMVNEGSTVLPYEPYTGGKPSPSPEYPQEIKSVGRLNEDTGKYEVDIEISGNFFDVTKVKTKTNLINNGDGSLHVINKSVIESELFGKLCPDLKVGETCVMRLESTGLSYISINGMVWDTGQAKTITQNILDSTVFFYGKDGSTVVIKNIRITRNTGKKMEYTPYRKPQLLTLTSDHPLTKWDRLVEQGGQIGWLYQSEIDADVRPSRIDLFPYGFNLYKNHENGTHTYRATNIKKAIGFQTSYCKQFKNKDAAYQSAEMWHYSDQPSMKAQYFNTDIPTREEFIEWMESNPLTMVYKTEKTEFVPLPQSEQNAIRALKTYYPTTVITVDGGELDPDIKVTYRKEI